MHSLRMDAQLPHCPSRQLFVHCLVAAVTALYVLTLPQWCSKNQKAQPNHNFDLVFF